MTRCRGPLERAPAPGIEIAHERGALSTKDYLEKDYYKTLGVAKAAPGRRDQEVVPEAGPQVPPGRQRG